VGSATETEITEAAVAAREVDPVAGVTATRVLEGAVAVVGSEAAAAAAAETRGADAVDAVAEVAVAAIDHDLMP